MRRCGIALGMCTLLISAGESGDLAAQTMELARDGGPGATVVAPADAAASAAALRDGLQRVLGVDFVLVAPDEIMDGPNWRLKDEWLGRPLILLGNVATNRAMFALFSQFLEGANSAYPGSGKYTLRVVFEPFRRGVHMVSLGASDPAGLDAGVARFVSLAEATRGSLGPLIEIGDTTGPTSRPSASGDDFIWAAGQWYWQGDAGAGQRAREVLMAEMAKPDPWGFLVGGHYDWERTYRPLRQMLASGLLSDPEREAVEQRLLAIALTSTDWAGLVPLQAAPGSATDWMTRHPISGLIAHYILYDYLAHVADVPPDKQAQVAEGHDLLRGHIESLILDDRYMSNEVGTQGVDNLSFMADMYLLLGDHRVVERGLFGKMADFYMAGKDNLGYQAGDDAYITCRPGAHKAYSGGGLPLLLAAFCDRDGQYRWLLDNTHHFMSHMQVPQPPEIAGLAAGVPPQEPTRYHGLSLLTMDPWWYRRCSSWQRDEMMTPLTASAEDSFTKAVFRDGHDPADAYLLLQGVNLGGPGGGEGFSANAIVRYTELGSILLFANTNHQTSWQRSVVSASRGEADPQGIACLRGAQFSTPTATGLESVQECEGGLRWSRAIVHRARGYFVCLDTLTAREEDTYNLTCRWRSHQPGDLIGDRRFEAVDGMLGVRFHLQGASPAGWQVALEPIDGAARPTMVRQFRREHLKPGESACFNNLFFASDAAHAREFELRPWTDRAVLVQGTSGEFQEMAAIGTGPLQLGTVTADARLWYVSREGLVLSGLRRVELPGLVSLEADADTTLGLLPGRGGQWLENPGSQPVRLTCRPEGTARLDGAPVPAAVELAAGRHSLELDLDSLTPAMGRELQALWDAARPAPSATPAAARPGPATLERVWTTPTVLPEFRRQTEVLATAEPPVEIGNVASWRDSLLGPPSGYGWHGSERAGWLPGTPGTIVLDLGSEVDVREIRLVRSRGPEYNPAHFRTEDFSFTLELSSDHFANDTRRREIAEPGLDTWYRENAHYMYTMRFPVLVLPVGEKARYVRITPQHHGDFAGDPAGGYFRAPDGTYSALLTDRETSFMEIEVVRLDREPRQPAWVRCGDFGGPEPRVLCQSGAHLLMLSSEGKVVWDRDLGSPLAADPVLADIDNDGRQEILTFSLAESFAAHDLEGNPRFAVDIREATKDEATSGYCSCRPACIAAWRPDAGKQLEYAFFPHYACYRVTAEPELAVTRIEHPGYARGGKFAFAVPDVTGDGREELAVVGLYGFGFGVIPSETPLEEGKLPSYLGHAPVTGYSSGNQEARLYHHGAVVRDAAGTWLGVVAVNPGGIDFFAPQDFAKRWSHFSHAPNLCSLLTDLNGDGKPEILLGREDGYVVAYEIEQGTMVAKVALNGAVRALAAAGSWVAAGTDRELTLLDASLQPLAHVDGPVESVGVLAGPDSAPLVIAAHSSGDVASYRVVAGKAGELP
ncbi:MAG: hypothetical protein FJX74_07400 [Armatimonadetes bacterium]|nr:hypothetical protein [Armatimonadota bacterium]